LDILEVHFDEFIRSMLAEALADETET
jgi:hypothetical protein